MDADDVERVVETEPELQADRVGREPTRDGTEDDRADRGQGTTGGVMATRPATTPEAAPMDVAWPSRSFSTVSQPSMAAQVATVVLIQTRAAVPSGASSDRR